MRKVTGKGALHPPGRAAVRGYWLCDVTGADLTRSGMVPLLQKLRAVKAKDFTSENAEMVKVVVLIRTHTQGRGIWDVDRGGDLKKLLERILLGRGERFVIRSAGKRPVIDRHKLQGDARRRGDRTVPAPPSGTHH